MDDASHFRRAKERFLGAEEDEAKLDGDFHEKAERLEFFLAPKIAFWAIFRFCLKKRFSTTETVCSSCLELEFSMKNRISRYGFPLKVQSLFHEEVALHFELEVLGLGGWKPSNKFQG